MDWHRDVQPRHYAEVEDAVDDIIERVGKRIVIGIPIGVGKPNHLVNALYRRADNDPTLTLDIFTGLTLGRASWSSELERRLVEPLNARLFGNYPELLYRQARSEQRLPDNVRVLEFFMEPGSLLSNADAQRHHVSSNYTHVARDVIELGVNVVAQLVSPSPDGDETYSFGTNSDVVLDVVPEMKRRHGSRCIVLGQVNHGLPFLYGDAVVPSSYFDSIVSDPRYEFDICGPPKLPVGTADHFIGLFASALVRDGGTLEIGFGALADALTSALELRQKDAALYRSLLERAAHDSERRLIDHVGGTGRLERGLYACTEMLGDGILDLFRAGIVRRRVHADADLQELDNLGLLGDRPSLSLLGELIDRGFVANPLGPADVERLVDAGLFRDEVRYDEDHLAVGDDRVECDFDRAGDRLAACLAPTFKEGPAIHAAFALGDRRFFDALRELPETERRAISMTSVSFVNDLHWPERLKRAQRVDARFFNSAMLATLDGSVVADGLEGGRVVSGVGGQYNFVAMAHALDDGRSVTLLKSIRDSKGRTESNIVWQYAHTTIPRHLRDIVVTEYGIADLRGQTDETVVMRLIEVADSRFQPELVAAAKRAGKLPKRYEVPEGRRRNLPETLEALADEFRRKGQFQQFPMGSELTREEATLGRALRRLESRVQSKQFEWPGWRGLGRVVMPPREAAPYLERLQLDSPTTARERLMQSLVVYALVLDGAVPA